MKIRSVGTSSSRPSEPRVAASIIVVTAGGRVLAGERAPTLQFMPEFLAFPGGCLEPEDDALAEALFGDERGVDGAVRAAALRELAEELGVVVDRDTLRSIPQALLSRPVLEIYRALSARPRAEDILPCGRWLTPEPAPIRFDTHFFTVTVRDECTLQPAPREVSWARFETPSAYLAAYQRFEILLAPPTRWALEVLARGLHDAARRMRAIPEANGVPPIDHEPIFGIRVVPLRTPTLPPATHTNTVIIGHEKLLVVDPATYEVEEREKLIDVLDRLGERGARVEGVVLTHHHADHIGSAHKLQQLLGIPILAHPITRDLVRPRVMVDRVIDEGERIDLDGFGALEVLFTPGHAPGHIVLADSRPGARAMIVGDMVAGIGTIIIDPPEGDMYAYLAQLRRLRARPKCVLFPAHGPVQVDSHKKFDEYIAHRLAREEKVADALFAQQVDVTAEDLLSLAYADTPHPLWPLAARSCLAHLEKLVLDGRATRNGDRFAARANPRNAV